MSWIVARIKWIMLVSGVLTCTMVHAAIAPAAAPRATFGETLEGPLARIVVRNRQQAGIAIAVDPVWVLLFAGYRVSTRRG